MAHTQIRGWLYFYNMKGKTYNQKCGKTEESIYLLADPPLPVLSMTHFDTVEATVFVAVVEVKQKANLIVRLREAAEHESAP